MWPFDTLSWDTPLPIQYIIYILVVFILFIVLLLLILKIYLKCIKNKIDETHHRIGIISKLGMIIL